MVTQKKILIFDAQAKNLLNFRGDLIKELLSHGHEVVGCSVDISPKVAGELAKLGVKYVQLSMSRTSLNPFKDIIYLFKLIGLIRRESPDNVLSYTVKPVVYGSLAACFARVPNVASTITGLGYAFIEQKPGTIKYKLIHHTVRVLYRLSLSVNSKVFFQNPDDAALFTRLGIVASEKVEIVNGSGVNLDHFGCKPVPKTATFLMVGRLLKDKGVYEYIEAARNLKKKYPEVRFWLIGGFDVNPAAVSKQEVKNWEDEGVIDYLGVVEDVREAMQAASIHVLPSYREGTPRSILEGLAIGRAIITTDVPGCRETVVNERNGFLVPEKDAKSLQQAMEQFVLDANLARMMGKESRWLAEKKFDVNIINTKVLTSLGLK